MSVSRDRLWPLGLVFHLDGLAASRKARWIRRSPCWSGSSSPQESSCRRRARTCRNTRPWRVSPMPTAPERARRLTGRACVASSTGCTFIHTGSRRPSRRHLRVRTRSSTVAGRHRREAGERRRPCHASVGEKRPTPPADVDAPRHATDHRRGREGDPRTFPASQRHPGRSRSLAAPWLRGFSIGRRSLASSTMSLCDLNGPTTNGWSSSWWAVRSWPDTRFGPPLPPGQVLGRPH